MRITLLLVLVLNFSLKTIAQVSIGSATPDSSAQLDVVATDKGILIPRIALTGSSDVTTVSKGNVTSLLVYNTATVADVLPGYYYWDGTEWRRIGNVSNEPWRDMTTGNGATDASTDIYYNNGNVGIGTASPSEKLHVVGAIKMVDGNEGANKVMISDVNGVASWQDAVNVSDSAWSLTGNMGTTPGTNFLGTTDSEDLIFKTKNTEFMRADTNGNVGIGTASPDAKLSINYGASNTLGLEIYGGGSVFYNAALRLWDRGTGANNQNAIEFDHNNAGTRVEGARIYSQNPALNGTTGAHLVLETASDNSGTFNDNQLFLDRGGNIGVGTSTPGGAIDVSRGVNGAIVDMLTFTSGGNSGLDRGHRILFRTPDANPNFHDGGAIVVAGMGAGKNTYMAFSTSDQTDGFQEQMRIINNGNVGIGLTSPGAKLEIEPDVVGRKGLIVRGLAGQTANLQEWYNDAGALSTRIDNVGTLRFSLNDNSGFPSIVGTRLGIEASTDIRLSVPRIVLVDVPEIVSSARNLSWAMGNRSVTYFKGASDPVLHVNQNGTVGIAQSSSTVELDVNGGVRLGDPDTDDDGVLDRDGSTAVPGGTMRWDDSATKLQVYDGATWVNLH